MVPRQPVGHAANNVLIPDQEKQDQDIEKIYEKLRAADAKLIGSDGVTRTLPSRPHAFLSRLLSALENGHSVTILQSDASLTTVEAGKLLGMSRQFLIGLLEQGEIPFYLVGSHRRLYVRDVLAYKVKRDSIRSKTINDLARTESEQGTYDKVPDDLHSRQ